MCVCVCVCMSVCGCVRGLVVALLQVQDLSTLLVWTESLLRDFALPSKLCSTRYLLVKGKEIPLAVFVKHP